MFGWMKFRKDVRHEVNPQSIDSEPSNAEVLKWLKGTNEYVLEVLDRVEEVFDNTDSNKELIRGAKGELFSALHQWIAQSTERERWAENREHAMVSRWREHAKSLTDQVELLKRYQAKPKAILHVILTQDSRDPSEWLRLQKTVEWPFTPPAGSSLRLKLFAGVYIYPIIEHYSIDNLDSLSALPELAIVLKPYSLKIDEDQQKLVLLHGYSQNADLEGALST